MIMTLNVPDHVAYYFHDVMCPVLKQSKEELDIFAEVFEKEFEKCTNDFPYIGEKDND